MPHTEQLESDRHLVRYLLDLLPEDEAERLDQASIADDDIATHLRVVESDLVDDYVLGSLTGETLQRFETRYLSSPRRRENVKMAARFLGAIERIEGPGRGVPGRGVPGAGVPGAGVPSARVLRAGVLGARVLGARVLLTMAAALVLAVGAAFMLRSVERSVPDSTARMLPAQIGVDATPKREEVSRAPAPAPAASQKEPSPNATAARRDPGVAALMLWPQTRSAGPLPTLLIPSGRARVALRLILESTPFARYRAALKDPSDNDIMWRSGWLTPTTSGSRTSIHIVVPTLNMRPQHYSIDLSGQSPDGASGIVESYTFRVGSR